MSESTASKVARKGLVGVWMEKRQKARDEAKVGPSAGDAMDQGTRGLKDMSEQVRRINEEREKRK